MYRSIIVVLLSVVMISLTNAQFERGDVELSFTGSLGSRSMKTSSSGYDDSQSFNFLFFGVSPGYFLADGFSVEPEIAVSFIEKEFPAWFLLGNVSYTYAVPGSRIAPFVRVGYRVSNSILAVPGTLAAFKVAKKMDVGVLNIGGGVKYQLTRSVFLRSEVNFKRYSWSDEYQTYYPIGTRSIDYTYTDIDLLLGFSVVL